MYLISSKINNIFVGDNFSDWDNDKDDDIGCIHVEESLMMISMAPVTVLGMTLLTGRMDHDEWSRPSLEMTPRDWAKEKYNTKQHRVTAQYKSTWCRTEQWSTTLQIVQLFMIVQQWKTRKVGLTNQVRGNRRIFSTCSWNRIRMSFHANPFQRSSSQHRHCHQ